ncbi:MAG: inositol monophosphatase family protein, partial [Alphaproteobacteria bacterium]
MLTIDLTLLEQMADIAKRAGAQILTVYKTDFEVETKGDNSPVTQADQLAEALITQAIQSEVSADIPIVGEEAVEAEGLKQPSGPVFWLVDPLDGTKEFVKRSGEFTVNIALIENGRPALGVVHL